MIKVRSIISNRDEKTKDDPINVIINSDGGDVYDMLGLVDYIESLSVKVNTICRGKAFSAAAILIRASQPLLMVSICLLILP